MKVVSLSINAYNVMQIFQTEATPAVDTTIPIAAINAIPGVTSGVMVWPAVVDVTIREVTVQLVASLMIGCMLTVWYVGIAIMQDVVGGVASLIPAAVVGPRYPR